MAQRGRDYLSVKQLSARHKTIFLRTAILRSFCLFHFYFYLIGSPDPALTSTLGGIVRSICLAALEIDNELKFHRLFDGQVRGCSAFKYLVDIGRGAPA